MRLRLFFLIFIFFEFTFYSYSQDKMKIENDSIILWSENRQLTWKDFKGKINALDDNSGFSARSSLNLQVIPSKKFGFNLLTRFKKNKAWSKSQDLSLLRHEQLHFDIMEIFARKVRKCFFEMKENNLKDTNLYFKAYNEIFDNYEIFDRLYDTETNHGQIIEKQKEWEEKIAKELEELKEYKYEPWLDIENN